MSIPALFTSDKVQVNPLKFGPGKWNAVTALLTGLLDGPDADGLVLSRDAASPVGAVWIPAPVPDLSGYVLTGDARLSDARVPLAHTHLFADLTISKADLGLGNVENTALSTWAGSANLVTLGTLPNLTVTGNVSAARQLLGDGTGLLPAVSFATEPAMGIWRVAAGSIRFTGAAGATAFTASATAFTAGGAAATFASVATAGTMIATIAAIAAVSTDGLVIQNSTAATAGVPVQQSPRLRFRSNVWNTTTPANNTNDWWIESVPVSAASPTGLLKFGSSLNGAAATYPLTLSNAANGVAAFIGDITAGGGLVVGPAQRVTFGSLGGLAAAGNGQFLLRVNDTATGVGLDVATDAILKVRTRAHTGYATVDALAYRASGVAGVSFGPAHPASITVVNGIVTACS